MKLIFIVRDPGSGSRNLRDNPKIGCPEDSPRKTLREPRLACDRRNGGEGEGGGAVYREPVLKILPEKLSENRASPAIGETEAKAKAEARLPGASKTSFSPVAADYPA